MILSIVIPVYKSENSIGPLVNQLFEVISDTENAAKSTLSAIMGRMATYTGKKITWDQIMNSKENLVPDNLSWNSEAPTLPDSNGNYKIPVPGKTKFI